MRLAGVLIGLLILTSGAPGLAGDSGDSDSARSPFEGVPTVAGDELADTAAYGGVTTGASGNCGSRSCTDVSVTGTAVIGDVTVGSANTRTNVSATNIFNSSFGTGRLQLGGADAAAAARAMSAAAAGP